jgi:hypothetical protein
MSKLNLLIVSLLIACALAYLNSLAFDYYWYWRYWWFDIVMHFLGGMMLGGIGLYFFSRRDQHFDLSGLLSLASRAAMVGLGIGLLWEFFEFGLDHVVVSGITLKTMQALQQGIDDTLGDLSLDVVGAVATAGIYYLLRSWKTRKRL